MIDIKRTPPANATRAIAGWAAVAISTTLGPFWAFWGSIENFHEGWFYPDPWRNLVLMTVQYLPWMFVPIAAGLLGLWRRALGVAAHVLLAAGAFWLFGIRSADHASGHSHPRPRRPLRLWHAWQRAVGPTHPDRRAGADRAYRIAYNGDVHAMLKKWGPPYMACRCVKMP